MPIQCVSHQIKKTHSPQLQQIQQLLEPKKRLSQCQEYSMKYIYSTSQMSKLSLTLCTFSVTGSVAGLFLTLSHFVMFLKTNPNVFAFLSNTHTTSISRSYSQLYLILLGFLFFSFLLFSSSSTVFSFFFSFFSSCTFASFVCSYKSSYHGLPLCSV